MFVFFEERKKLVWSNLVKENKRKVTKSKNKTQNRTQNKTENNQNMKKTEHNELLSFLRVFDVLVQYCLTS